MRSLSLQSLSFLMCCRRSHPRLQGTDLIGIIWFKASEKANPVRTAKKINLGPKTTIAKPLLHHLKSLRAGCSLQDSRRSIRRTYWTQMAHLRATLNCIRSLSVWMLGSGSTIQIHIANTRACLHFYQIKWIMSLKRTRMGWKYRSGTLRRPM